MAESPVRIPGEAVSPEDKDLREPTRELLEDLRLLGTREETDEASSLAATFTGPPPSVALIEAGATAVAKWWATGLGAAAVVVWGNVAGWWTSLDPDHKTVALAGAAFVSGLLVIAIGYLLASDVRGRASAAEATIRARAQIAETMIRAARDSYEPPSADVEVQIIPLPRAIRVRRTDQPEDNKDGWLAIAIELRPGKDRQYIVVKGSVEDTVAKSKLEFVTSKSGR
jgi:hypothetical protein